MCMLYRYMNPSIPKSGEVAFAAAKRLDLTASSGRLAVVYVSDRHVKP